MKYTPCLVERRVAVDAFYTAFRQDFYYKTEDTAWGEAHDFWELLLVLDGQISATAGRTVHILEPGEMILHRPMEFHRHRSIVPLSHILILSFDAGKMPPLSHYVFSLTEKERQTLDAVLDGILSSFTVVNNYVRALPPENALRAQGIVCALEGLLAGLFERSGESPAGLHLPEAETFRRAVAFLYDRMAEPLTANDVAGACSVSLATLKRLFSRFAGIGVMTYLRKLRLTRAAGMLLEGSTVSDAAAAVGFSSLPVFSNAFRAATGVSPTDYRKRK